MATAQTSLGTITGRIEDTSGARIPGVTITVTSPAIQGQRDTITDESGNYRFANLPVGTYAVKFELPGFKTLIRQDIIVQAGVSTTLNPQLEVATVAETVTVTGESPVVDLEQAKIGVNFGSAVKDNVVNARNYWALLSQSPGLKTTTPDVGGSTMGTQVGYRSYGISGQNQIYLDGVNLTEGNNGGSMYGDYGSWAEVNVSSAGNSAETRTAGSTVNAVVRSGGNQFHSTVLGAYQGSGFQSTNFSEDLKKTGLGTGDKFSKYYDTNADFSGPFKKDKFWFYGSFRNEYSGLATNMRQAGGQIYVLPTSGIAPNLCDQLPCGNTVDGSAVGAIFFTRLTNGTSKLNYQLNSQNQLSATANIREKFQPYRGGSGSNAKNVNPDSSQQQQSWFHTFTVQWTSTIDNRTTLNVSLNNFGYHWVNLRNSTGPRITDRAATSTLTGGYTQGAYIRDLNANRRWHEDAVVSRFFNAGGAHNLKVGYEYLWEDYRGSTGGYPDHILYTFNNGKPDRVTVYNTPVQWEQNGMIDNSFYLQDKWDVSRKLTLNLGFRFDSYDVFNPAQVRESAGGNPFNAATDIPGLGSFGNKQWDRQEIKTFNMPAPRFSLIYDVFGDGKTAIKASYGLFAFNPSYDLAGSALENGTKSAVFNWNGMLPINTPDALRACLAATGPNSGHACSLNSAPSLLRPAIDPNIKLGYTHEYTIGLDQQLWSDFNLRANFIRKIEAGGYGTINREYTLSDWVPFQFNDPGFDGVLGTPDDNPLGHPLTAWNRTKTAPAADQFITYSRGSGNMYRTFEIEGVKRMSHHFLIVTGADWTKLDFGASVFSNNANTIIGQTIYPASHYWDWTGKLTLQYEGPYGTKISSVYKTQKGSATSRTVNINCDRLVGVGQTCAGVGGKAPLQGSFDLTVEGSGSAAANFLPTLSTLDVSIGKTFKLGEKQRIEGLFDLFNVANSNAIQGWGSTSATTSFTYNGTAVTGYPTYHRPSSILPPRVFRLSARYSF
jgi:Carboxypeptidase regulatory-like domain